MKILSKHYLRRRADARCKQIRRWQEDAGDIDGRGNHFVPSAVEHLRVLGIEQDTPVMVRKRGKWDARYEVFAP